MIIEQTYIPHTLRNRFLRDTGTNVAIGGDNGDLANYYNRDEIDFKLNYFLPTEGLPQVGDKTFEIKKGFNVRTDGLIESTLDIQVLEGKNVYSLKSFGTQLEDLKKENVAINQRLVTIEGQMENIRTVVLPSIADDLNEIFNRLDKLEGKKTKAITKTKTQMAIDKLNELSEGQ